ncbi:MAG: pyridoxamine 5'-phosphate oxidase family protein [Anaerolineales bacterium]|nr:pyridoxamine 5'-phosphate oxidase family protein [Anaerolineales bacterium]
MRRAEKELAESTQIEEILRKADVIRLALFDGKEPYIVPLLYGYDGEQLYFHSAGEGRKIEILRSNPRVCFECEIDVRIKPSDKICSWSLQYRSVVGYGVVRFLTDPAEKRKAMETLLDHYTDPPYDIEDTTLQRTCMFVVEIESLCGKSSPVPKV